MILGIIFASSWNYSFYASQFKKSAENVYVAEIDDWFVTITVDNGKIQTICKERYYEGVLISCTTVIFTGWGETGINEIEPTPLENCFGTAAPDYSTEAGWRALFEMDNVTVRYTQETIDSTGAKSYIYGEYRIAGTKAVQTYSNDFSDYPYAYTDGVNVYRYGVKDTDTTPQQLIAEFLERWDYADDFAYFTEISAGVYQLSYVGGGGVTVTIEGGKIQKIEHVFLSNGGTTKQTFFFVNYGTTVIE